MLDKIVEEQLAKLEVARVSLYDEGTHRYLFKKVGPSKLEVGKSYLIHLDKNLTNKDMSGTLASNWNHGLVPLHQTMEASVKDRMGTMYLVHGVYVNDDNSPMQGEPLWEGWLPIEKICILEERN